MPNDQADKPEQDALSSPTPQEELPKSGLAEGFEIDPEILDQVFLASDDLIPHPSTHPQMVPIGSVENSETKTAQSPVKLTAEIFASGSIPTGTMLGHFMIKSYIGGGGMGRVYLATDTALDRLVAVKVLPRQRANDQATVARFMNEAKSAARLNHEHIAQVYFAGEQDGIPYIAFEYVEGTNIRALVDDFDAFPLPQALNYLIQIAHALAHAATHGVVHRDVKPSNILITKEGRAKLIDMGLARLLNPSETKDDLTASGVTLGTFDYISPEQARDPRSADIRSDIYSLGCTFFFMLSGRPPFPEGTVLQKLLQHQGDEPPDIRSFQPNIPSEVAVLLQRMMAKDPKQRFQTPDSLIEALVQVAKMIGLQPTGPGKLVWEMSPPSKTSQVLRHVPWIGALLLLIIIYFPLNLYWGQSGKLELPKMDSITFPEELVDSAHSRPTGEGEPSPGAFPFKDTTGNAALSTLLRWGYLSPLRFQEEVTRRFFTTKTLAGKGELVSVKQKELGLWVAPESVGFAWPLHKRVEAHLSVSELPSAGPYTPTPAPPEEEIIVQQHFCVDPSASTPDAFETLDAALAEAGKNAVIELKWNDVLKVDPMLFVGRRLKFHAAENYRPIILFEPSDALPGSLSARNMITLASTQMEFVDLAIEMRIRQEDMGLRWSLFDLIGTSEVVFERCMLTIRNAAADHTAYHREVAFFRNSIQVGGFEQLAISGPTEWSSAPPWSAYEPDTATETGLTGALSRQTSARGTTEETTGQLTIRMVNSILRGEATALQCDVPQEIDFHAENSFIALAESFVRAEDSKRTSVPESRIRITMDHVTYFGKKAFAKQFRNSFETEPMRLQIDVGHCVFILNNMPMAEFRGARLIADAMDAFKWSGRSNYLQHVSIGWRFRPASTSSDGGVTYEMPLDEWKEKVNSIYENNNQTATQIDALQLDDVRKPMYRLLPADLKLRPKLGDFVDETASAPGVSLQRLPVFAPAWTGND